VDAIARVTSRPPADAISLFISYRRVDSAGHVGRLHDHLAAIQVFRAGGIFRDIDSINFGDDFVRAMRLAVEFADVLLAVIGREWSSIAVRGRRRIEDPYDPVRIEIVSAFALGVPVIPVLVNGATMPQGRVLPRALRPLATTNAIDLTDTRFAHDVERLADAIQKAAAGSKRRHRRRAAPADAGPYRAMGDHFLQQGDYVSARRNLVAAARAQPDSAAVRTRLSTAYQMEALENIESANYGLADTLLDQAEDAARQALLADDTDEDALVQLAYVRKDRVQNFRELKRDAEANDALARAHAALQMVLARNPRNASAWNGRANLAFIESDFARAIEFGRRAVELDAAYTFALYDLARAYEARAEHARAGARRAALASLIEACRRLIALEEDGAAASLPEDNRADVRRMRQWAATQLRVAPFSKRRV
jgi:tetratricopeptide (TPR) repeat protein